MEARGHRHWPVAAGGIDCWNSKLGRDVVKNLIKVPILGAGTRKSGYRKRRAVTPNSGLDDSSLVTRTTRKCKTLASPPDLRFLATMLPYVIYPTDLDF